MTDTPPFLELRPRDFTARTSRAASARSLADRHARRHAGRRLAIVAAAVAVPAMAAPASWPSEPTASRSVFDGPGSTSAHLDKQPYSPVTADGPPAEEAGYALPRSSADGIPIGPAAHALRFTGSATDRARAGRCLTMAIYYEAAREADAGQRAVAQVVLNRVAHPNYPDTVCGVVFQGSERATGCQFTFACDGSLAREPAHKWWDRAAKIADAALAGAVYAPVGLATHYHTVDVHPYWAESLDRLGTIGAHRFYRWRGAAGRPSAFSDRYVGGEPIAAPHPRASTAPAASIDPVALAQAYEAEIDSIAAAPARNAPGEAPGPGEVRAEYARSGHWIRQP